MRLVYDEGEPKAGEEVKVGDTINRDGNVWTITNIFEPHKFSSSGKVCVKWLDTIRQFYVGVIGATWIEREDR